VHLLYDSEPASGAGFDIMTMSELFADNDQGDFLNLFIRADHLLA
jgi:hypothetical protein